MPNINELMTLWNPTYSVPLDWMESQGFEPRGVYNPYTFWSSTTFEPSSDRAFVLVSGSQLEAPDLSDKSSNYGSSVLPVRSLVSGPAPPIRTGQTKSYLSGDDGDLKTGAPWPEPRFTDKGDGTVLDNLTGLVWRKNVEYSLRFWFTWEQAFAKLEEINGDPQALYRDWRIPNINELRSIADYSQAGVVLPAGHPFESVPDFNYEFWSSTRYNSDEVWTFDLQSGKCSPTGKNARYNLWTVRGGPVPPVLSVKNVTRNLSYEKIQDAIDDVQLQVNDEIVVFEEYGETENITVDTAIAIRSNKGSAMTRIRPEDSSKPVFDILVDEVVLEGFTVEGSSTFGVRIQEKYATLRDMIVRDNGVGIESGLRPGVRQGLLDSHTTTLTLENVQVTGNQGDGVYAESGVLVKGEGNVFSDNGGSAITTFTGGIKIGGTGTEAKDNKGSGLVSNLSFVVVEPGAMTSVTGNGDIGIAAATNLELPAGFIVENNGGPGIDIADPNATLENIKARNNDGPGIVFYGNLTLTGTETEITGNSGDGLQSPEMDYELRITGSGAKIENNNGWGIFTGGKVTIEQGALDGIRNNLGGGIIGSDIRLPAGFAIENNGGPGIDAANSVLTLESVKIKDNGEEGVSARGDLLVKGDGNEITGNAGDGIKGWKLESTIYVSGGCAIENNGGWGIFTVGDLTVDPGFMDGIRGNAKGGIMASKVSLPQGFIIENNGEAGIDMVNAQGPLKDIVVRNNGAEGMSVSGSVSITGTSEIAGNAKDGIIFGISGGSTSLTLVGTAIRDNGAWGVKILGGELIAENTDISGNKLGGVLFSSEESKTAEQSDEAVAAQARSLQGESRITDSRIATNQGDGVLFEEGLPLFLENNAIEQNQGRGVANLNADLVVQAPGNWWGDPSGPGGAGPGTGDEITENVEATTWMQSAPYLVVSLEKTEVEAGAGETVANIVHIRNWNTPDDIVEITVSDSLGWSISPTSASVSLVPDSGGSLSLDVAVPSNASTNQLNSIRIAVVSANNPSAQASATFEITVNAGAAAPIPALSTAAAFFTAIVLSILTALIVRKKASRNRRTGI